MLHAFRAFFRTLENDCKATDENQIIMFLAFQFSFFGRSQRRWHQNILAIEISGYKEKRFFRHQLTAFFVS